MNRLDFSRYIKCYEICLHHLIVGIHSGIRGEFFMAHFIFSKLNGERRFSSIFYSFKSLFHSLPMMTWYWQDMRIHETEIDGDYERLLSKGTEVENNYPELKMIALISFLFDEIPFEIPSNSLHFDHLPDWRPWVTICCEYHLLHVHAEEDSLRSSFLSSFFDWNLLLSSFDHTLW